MDDYIGKHSQRFRSVSRASEGTRAPESESAPPLSESEPGKPFLDDPLVLSFAEDAWGEGDALISGPWTIGDSPSFPAISHPKEEPAPSLISPLQETGEVQDILLPKEEAQELLPPLPVPRSVPRLGSEPLPLPPPVPRSRLGSEPLPLPPPVPRSRLGSEPLPLPPPVPRSGSEPLPLLFLSSHATESVSRVIADEPLARAASDGQKAKEGRRTGEEVRRRRIAGFQQDQRKDEREKAGPLPGVSSAVSSGGVPGGGVPGEFLSGAFGRVSPVLSAASGVGAGGTSFLIPPLRRTAYRTRRFPRFVFFGVLLFLLLGVGVAGGAYWYANSVWNKIERVVLEGSQGQKVLTDKTADAPITFLILGSDSREDLSAEVRKEYDGKGNAQIRGKRSDVLMLVHVNPHRKEKSYVLPLPRDLIVPIPGIGKAKINAAYNKGPGRVVETVVNLTGIAVNHYVEFNFETFRGAVDALGEVEICTEYSDVRDKGSDLDLRKEDARAREDGMYCHDLDGRGALSWVRSRKFQMKDEDGKWRYDGTGDLGRIERQRELIFALLDKVGRSKSALLHWGDYVRIAEEFVMIDDEFDFGTARSLFERFVPFDKNRVEFLELPVHIRGDQSGLDLLSEAEDLFLLLGSEIDRTRKAYDEAAEETQAREKGKALSVREREALSRSEIDRADFAVRVLNGAGVRGLAARTKKDLKARGWSSAGVGDAVGAQRGRRKSRIMYSPGDPVARAAALHLQVDLDYGEVQPGLVAGADLLLVLGADASPRRAAGEGSDLTDFVVK